MTQILVHKVSLIEEQTDYFQSGHIIPGKYVL